MRTHLRAWFALLGICSLAPLSSVNAQDHDLPRKGDYTAIPDIFIYCTTCHGVEFGGNAAVDAPRLTGLDDWYLRSQMLAFKKGLRGTHPADLIGMEMRPQAAALTETEIDAVVALVGRIANRPDTHDITVSGDATRGSALFATCSACHGSKGEGQVQNENEGEVRSQGKSEAQVCGQEEGLGQGEKKEEDRGQKRVQAQGE